MEKLSRSQRRGAVLRRRVRRGAPADGAPLAVRHAVPAHGRRARLAPRPGQRHRIDGPQNVEPALLARREASLVSKSLVELAQSRQLGRERHAVDLLGSLVARVPGGEEGGRRLGAARRLLRRLL